MCEQEREEISQALRVFEAALSRGKYLDRNQDIDRSDDPQGDAYDYSGTSTVYWSIIGEHPCPVCLMNADAGEIRLGDLFPSGHNAPPAHPNCSCILRDGNDDEPIYLDDSIPIEGEGSDRGETTGTPPQGETFRIPRRKDTFIVKSAGRK